MGQQRIIEYGIRFNPDQGSLNNIRTQLTQLTALLDKPNARLIDGTKETAELNKVRQSIKEVQAVFDSAFNSNLGTVNIQKLNQGLKSLNIQKVAADFSRLGAVGQNAFGDITAKILTTNTTLQKTGGFLTNIAKTLGDSLKWSLAYGAINAVGNAIRQSYDYVIDLDTSLNDIRIVTGKSADEMDRFARQANRVAKELGVSTKAYTDASLIFYQQGLSDTEANERARITSMAANVTGQSASAVSEQLTAIWNGYKVDAAEAEVYIDKVAKVAAQTGADLEELSTGMSKVASAANIMGVDIDELNAQLATVITVTRQAPESVGTAFKTIYARINAIESGSEDAETTLKSYTNTMLKYGINVLDMNGKLRDTGDVIAEIGEKWGAMTKEQQLGLAQAMAGQRQYNNLLSLFDNWDMYEQSLETSKNAAGTLAEQNAIYLESAEASLQRLSTSAERLYSSIFDVDSIKDVAGGLTIMVDGMANFIESIGGGAGALMNLGAIGLRVFSTQIANSIMGSINNMKLMKQQTAEVQASVDMARMFPDLTPASTGYEQLAGHVKEVYNITTNLNEQQRTTLNDLITNLNNAQKSQNTYNEEISETAILLQKLQEKNINTTDQGAMRGTVDMYSQDAAFMGRLGDSTQLAGGMLVDMSQDVFGYKKALVELGQATGNVEQKNQNLIQSAKAAQAAFADSKNEIMLTEAQATKLAAAEQQLDAALDNSSDSADAAKNYYQTLMEVLRGSVQNTEDLANKLNGNLVPKVKQADAAVDQITSAFQQFKTQLDLSSRIQNLTRGLSGLASVASGFTTLANLGDIWNDDDLSTGEKMLQIITNVGFALPMVISGLSSISQLKTAFSGLGTAISTFFSTVSAGTATTAVDTVTTEANTAAKAKNAVAQEAIAITNRKTAVAWATKTLGIEKDTVETLLNAGVTKGLITEEERAKMVSEKWTFAKIAQTFAKKMDTQATAENTAHQEINSKSNDKNTKSIIANKLARLGWKLVIVAAVVAVLAVINKLIKSYESEAEAAERSAKATANANKALTENAKATRTVVNNIKQDFERYKDIITTLDACTKGTSAWKDALENAKLSAEELIEKYPQLKELASLYKWDEERGTYVLDVEAVEKEIVKAEKSTSVSTTAAAAGEYQEAKKTRDASRGDLFDFDRKYQYDVALRDFVDRETNATAGLTWGEQYRAAAESNDYNEFVDKLVDLFAEQAARRGLTLDKDKFRTSDFIKTYYNEIRYSNWRNMAEDWFVADGNLQKEFDNAIISIAEQSTEAIATYKSSNIVVDNQGYTNAWAASSLKTQEQIRNLLNKIFDKGVNATLDEGWETDLLKNYFGVNTIAELIGSEVEDGFNKRDETGGILLTKLIELTGGQYIIPEKDAKGREGSNRNLVWGDDKSGNRKFWLQVRGEKEAREVEEQDIYGYIASKVVMENSGALAGQVDSALQAITEKGGAGANALYSLISTGSLDNASTTDVISLMDQIAKAGSLKKFVEGFSDRQIKTMGFADAEAMIEELGRLLPENKESVGFKSTQLKNADAQSWFEDKKADGFDKNIALGIQSKMGGHLDKIFNLFGKEAGADLATALGDTGLRAIANFDFSKGNYEDFVQQLKQAGIATDDLGENLLTYWSYVNNSSKTAYSAIAAEEQRAKQYEAIKELHLGDTIEASVFAETFENTPMADFFTETENGMYMLKQDAIDWYSTIKKYSQDQNRQEAEALKSELENANKIKTEAGQAEYLHGKGLITDSQKNDSTAVKTAWDKYIKDLDAQIKEKDRGYVLTADTIEEMYRLAEQVGNYDIDTSSVDYLSVLGQELSNLGYTETAFRSYVDSLGLAGEQAERTALANLHLKQGIEDLNESWPEWNAAIEEGVSNPEYWTSIGDIKDLLGETFGFDGSKISNEWVLQHLSLIGKAARDEEGAIESLQKEFKGYIDTVGDIPDFDFPEFEPPDLSSYEDQIDYLYEIETKLKRVRSEQEKLKKEAEHLSGEDLTENLEKQATLREEELELISAGTEKMRERADTIRETLSADKFGIEFDAETQEMSNYTERLKHWYDTVKDLENQKAIAEYEGNSKAADNLEKRIQEAKRIIEILSTLGEEYNNLLWSEIPSWESDAYDIIYETTSDAIGDAGGDIKLQIDVDLDIHELNKKWREFERTMKWEEGAFGTITAIAQDKLDQLNDYYGEDGIIAKLTSHLQTYLPDPDATGSLFGMGKNAEAVEKYLSELISTMEEAEDLIREIKQAMVDLMDEAQEAFDTQISRYEALNSILEHNINLLNLLDGEENNYAAKQAFYDQQTESYISQLDFNRQQVEFWKEQLALAEEGSEAAKVAEENLIAAIENSQSTLEEAIEHAQAAHINSIRSIFEELEDQITGGKGLAQLNKEWELIKGNADFYLDDVNKAYELSKLEANYRKSIDESSSTSAQRELNAMMNAELSMLKEKDKLTQYDIDRANLKYQLTLKQIALEDAQKNKSTMRLKRDANGNYSYQYVADSSATASLEQEIADLNNQIHNLDKDALRNNLDEFLQLYQEFQEEMIAIEEAGGTEEEKEEKRLALRKLYGERANDLLRENNHLMQQLDQKTIKAIQGHWDIGIQNIIDLFNGNGGFEEVVKDTYAKIDTESYNFQNTLQRMADAAGKDLDAIYKGFDKNLTILQPLIDKNKDLVQIYDEEMVQMWGVVDALSAVVESYSNMRDIAWDAAAAAKAHYEAIAALGAVSSGGGGYTGGGYTPTPTPNPQPNPDEPEDEPGIEEESDWIEYGDELANAILSGNGGDIRTYLSLFPVERVYDYLSQSDIGAIASTYDTDPDSLKYEEIRQWLVAIKGGSARWTFSSMKEYINKNQIEEWFGTSFNTGGYTGEWANGDRDGRLAFLHQKELVLKDTDTANLLKTVDVVRSLDMSLMSRVAGMLGQIGLHSLGAYTPESAPIEQNVHIDAHFPNVSSAQEIQEAFDQLADQLGQMLYQNKK